MKSKLITMAAFGLLACSMNLTQAADAAENWSKNCASCHAKDGTGNTAMGKKKGVVDLTDGAVQAKLTDADATKIIKSGLPDKMKGYGDKLSDAEIAALVAQVRAFKK